MIYRIYLVISDPVYFMQRALLKGNISKKKRKIRKIFASRLNRKFEIIKPNVSSNFAFFNI